MAFHTGTRASDADRTRVVDALATAFSEGQISQAEYEDRSRAALQSPTLAELRGLTQDLQSSPTLVGEPDVTALPPTHTTGTGWHVNVWPWVFRLMTIGAVVGVVVFGYRTFSSIGDEETTSTTGPGDDAESGDGEPVADIAPLVIPEPPEMMTVDALETMIALMRKEIATTVVNTLNIQEAAASFEVQRKGEPGTYSYYYDGFVGVPSHNATSTNLGDHLDLADLDIKALMRLMDGLPARFDIPDATSRHISVDFNDYYARGPSVFMYISGPTRTGYLVASPGGRVLMVQPPS